MPRARTPAKPPAAKTTIHDTGVDPLGTFLADRPGWSKDDTGDWCHTDRDLRITTAGPGNASRFACSIKGSKPVTFGTRTGVECWVITAGA